MKLIQKNNVKQSDIVVLLDASASMGYLKKQVIGTFGEYLSKVRSTNKTIAVYTFDSSGLVEVYSGIHVEAAKLLEDKDYTPAGMTPLYDAVYKVMELNPGKVDFIIHTDGEENDSHDVGFDVVNREVTRRAEQGSQFTWLGEGLAGTKSIDQFNAGNKVYMSSTLKSRSDSMSFAAGKSVSYTATGAADNKDKINLSS